MDLKQRPGWEDFLERARMMFFEKAGPTSMGEGVQAVAAWAYETGRSDATRDAEVVPEALSVCAGDHLLFIVRGNAAMAELEELRELLGEALPGIDVHVMSGPVTAIHCPGEQPRKPGEPE